MLLPVQLINERFWSSFEPEQGHLAWKKHLLTGFLAGRAVIRIDDDIQLPVIKKEPDGFLETHYCYIRAWEYCQPPINVADSRRSYIYFHLNPNIFAYYQRHDINTTWQICLDLNGNTYKNADYLRRL